ncbi:MAG: hypothetical protein R2831_11140 [Chitinophagaceae bacterium]
MKLIKFLIELYYWILISLSPVFATSMLCVLFTIFFPNILSRSLFLIIIGLSYCIGIVWSSIIWKTTGTSVFYSRISSSSDLD